MARYICPYCYKEHKMNDVHFRCINRQCTDENDAQLAKYKGKASYLMLKAFPYSGRGGKMPEYADCPACGVATGIRLCPDCHNPLPQSTTEGNDMIISIVGARDSGKSNYVGVLAHELKRRVCSGFDVTFGMVQESKEEYDERFGRSLYPQEYAQGIQQARRVERTESHMRGKTLVMSQPIVCELGKKSGNKIKRYSISLLDSAGEDFDDKAVMATVMPYLAHSKGIIFLLDPMQIPDVRNQLDEEVVSSSSSTQLGSVISYSDIITNVAESIRTVKKLKKDKALDIPVVITFSKFDTLKGIVDSSSKLWKDSPHVKEGSFDMADMQQVNDEIVGLLCGAWGAEGFVAKVRQEFKNAIFLPCSAFGSCPNQDGSMASPKSLRLEDGMLWIWGRNGIIPVKNNK